MSLRLQPITQREAFAWIEKHHRTHGPPPGFKFAIAVSDGDQVVGVACVGRPVAAALQDGWTAEITRVCTIGHPNAASKLYGACCRAARAMGYQRVITYLEKKELGSSTRAAGFKALYDTRGGSWSRRGRPRIDTHPTSQKTLWEAPGG